jgi:hypothetical protein
VVVENNPTSKRNEEILFFDNIEFEYSSMDE